jgi:hypothetical protein
VTNGRSVAQQPAQAPLADSDERAELTEVVRELHLPKPRARVRPAQPNGYTKLCALYKPGKPVDPKRVAAEVARCAPPIRRSR